MSMELVVEAPYQKERRFPWDEATKKRFDLDRFDVESLENGDTLWQGDVALNLENETNSL
jgi:hypothetical protein